MSQNNSGHITLALVLGATVFVVAFLMLLVFGDYTFSPAFFLAALLSLLTTVVLYLGFGLNDGEDLSGLIKPGSATTSPAPAAQAAPAQAAASAAPAATAAPAPAEASGAEAPVEDDAGQPVADAAEPVAVAETPAAADPGPDYDGDGVQEGEGEGTRPAGLYEARDGKPDDLKAIKGVGPKLEQLCNSLGFWHFDQIANWTADEVAWVDANLKGFKGRVSRDNWVEQAGILASGGETEFSKRVEDGGVY